MTEAFIYLVSHSVFFCLGCLFWHRKQEHTLPFMPRERIDVPDFEEQPRDDEKDRITL